MALIKEERISMPTIHGYMYLEAYAREVSAAHPDSNFQ
jgi:hypothetical protein